MEMSFPRSIWVVRHTEREDNVNREWRQMEAAAGLARDNSMLSERGRHQAAQCAHRFKGADVQHVFASPFDRTVETASIIVDGKGLGVKTEPGLCEPLYFCCKPPGFWEAAQLKEKFPLVDTHYKPIYTKATLPHEDRTNKAVPRVKQTIKRITEEYEGNLLLVSHGPTISAIFKALTGEFSHVGRASVSCFTESSRGQFVVEYCSDSSHLHIS